MHETLNSVVEWINRAGAAHWNFAAPMFVQTAVLVGVLCIFEACLRRRVRAAVRYWLWALVAVKLLLPVTLSTPASIAYWIVPKTTTGMTIEHPVVNRPIDEVTHAHTSVADEAPVPNQALTAPFPNPISPNTFAANPPAGGTEAGSESLAVAPIAPAYVASPSAAGWLFIAWLGGAVTLAAIVVRRAHGARQLSRRASGAPPALQQQLESVCELLNLPGRRIQVKVSDDLGCPAICGVWRPVILIPRRLVSQLDDRQLRLIFVHELSHWQRWDMQINLLQTILQIVYFYNLALWIANSVLRRLREEAVDDAVLVAMAGATQSYGHLLLDVAEQFRRPAELSLRMIGIIESRKALTQRIRRIAASPVPRTARLGFWGFIGVAVTGLALVPMAAGPSTRAGDAAVSERGATTRQTADSTVRSATVTDRLLAAADVPEKAPDQAAVLSGRITDEEGEPVTDARVQVHPVEGGRVEEVRADRDGNYSIKKVAKVGKYNLLVRSKRCIGLTEPKELPVLLLDAEKPTVCDVTLKLGCQLRVQTVDETGKPIPNVHFFKPGRHDGEGYFSDKEGWVTIGGLSPSSSELQFAARSEKYAIARLTVTLDDPKLTVHRTLVLSDGIAVDGSVICADGKPAAGWHVLALPAWWNYASSPNGVLIGEDGSFSFPHVGPGPHKISLSIPIGPGLSMAPVVMADVDLAKHEGPLKINVEYPSPGSMVLIEGEIKFAGGQPKRGFWVHANSNKTPFSGGHYLQPGEDKFRLGPLPPGPYRISFESSEIEPKELQNVAAPAKDLKVELKVRGQLVLRGAVTRENGEPVEDYRLRVVKIQTLRGPNYGVDQEWKNVSDPKGRFEVNVPGPGVYAVEAVATGFAIARSDEVNTDTQPDKQVVVKLSRGKTLAGTVVNEEGKPIDGAVVVSLMRDGYPLPVSADNLRPGVGVKSQNGKFELVDLKPGKDMLHIVHPDYVMSAVEELEINASGEQPPLKIVMQRGCLLRGRVYDNDGEPAPDVTLHFRTNEASSGPDEKEGRFAAVTTDGNGRFEVARLPHKLVHIHRQNEWEAMGVVRLTVLPDGGKVNTVDFGGPSKVTGRLVVNGVPVAGKKLLLSGENPHFGVMKAHAMTDAKGVFAFRGVPAGEHILYYPGPDRPQDWIRVKALRFGLSDSDLGTISQDLGKLIVLWPEAKVEQPEEMQISLQYYDPVWFGLEFINNPARRQPGAAQTAFDNLASGKFALSVYRKGKLGIRQVVDFDAKSRESTVTLDFPQGRGALRGSLDVESLKEDGNRHVELRSEDESLFAYLEVKQDGTFEFEGLPDGDYFLTQQSIRNPDRVAQFSLRNGETKTIAISKGTLQMRFPKGYLRVQAFTSEGVLMEGCDVALTGPKGAVPRHGSQRGMVSFTAEPGPYQLTVGFPGFEPVRQQVELKETNGRLSVSDHEVNVKLVPSGE
jgi:beta-lactamase regulating signal transducer with metallopeptidase domain